MHQKSVLVIGCSGFIGRNACNYFAGLGWRVSGLDFTLHPELSKSVGFRRCDITELSALTDCLRVATPEYVVHLAARTDLLGRKVEDYGANTLGVENIIRACSGVSSIRRVIFASSRMVCRIDHVPGSYEEYSPPNAYGESKVRGEQIVREARPPFEWSIGRPTSIWGPGFGIPYRNFFDQVKRNRYVHPGKHQPLKSFGYVDNTVFQLQCLLSADRGKVHGRTFYLGDYDPLNVGEWAEYIHRAFGLPGRVRSVPMPLLRVAGLGGDVINRVTGRDRAPLTSFRLRNLITNMVYPQLAELREVTGPLPFGWKQGSLKTAAWVMKEAGQLTTAAVARLESMAAEDHLPLNLSEL